MNELTDYIVACDRLYIHWINGNRKAVVHELLDENHTLTALFARNLASLNGDEDFKTFLQLLNQVETDGRD